MEEKIHYSFEELVGIIARLRGERHFTVVMVTHNQNIANMADTVLKMNSGEMVDCYRNPSPKTAYEIGW